MKDLRETFFLPGPADAIELRAFTHGSHVAVNLEQEVNMFASRLGMGVMSRHDCFQQETALIVCFQESVEAYVPLVITRLWVIPASSISLERM